MSTALDMINSCHRYFAANFVPIPKNINKKSLALKPFQFKDLVIFCNIAFMQNSTCKPQIFTCFLLH